MKNDKKTTFGDIHDYLRRVNGEPEDLETRKRHSETSMITLGESTESLKTWKVLLRAEPCTDGSKE